MSVLIPAERLVRARRNPRRVVTAPARATLAARAEWRGEIASARHLLAQRPKTRAECAEVVRPCVHVSCRYNLFLDSSAQTGTVTFLRPNLEPGDMDPTGSCALDVAEQGEHTLEEVSQIFGVSRERVRQLEEKFLRTVRRNGGADYRAFADIDESATGRRAQQVARTRATRDGDGADEEDDDFGAEPVVAVSFMTDPFDDEREAPVSDADKEIAMRVWERYLADTYDRGLDVKRNKNGRPTLTREGKIQMRTPPPEGTPAAEVALSDHQRDALAACRAFASRNDGRTPSGDQLAQEMGEKLKATKPEARRVRAGLLRKSLFDAGLVEKQRGQKRVDGHHRAAAERLLVQQAAMDAGLAFRASRHVSTAPNAPGPQFAGVPFPKGVEVEIQCAPPGLVFRRDIDAKLAEVEVVSQGPLDHIGDTLRRMQAPIHLLPLYERRDALAAEIAAIDNALNALTMAVVA